MGSKAIQKRANSKPQGQSKDISNTTHSVSRAVPTYPEKIVGMSLKGIVFLSLITLGIFNYLLIKELKTIKTDLSDLKYSNELNSKIILGIQKDKDIVTKGDLIAVKEKITKDVGIELDLMKKMNNNQWVQPRGEMTVFDKFNNVDPQKYVINSVRAYPDFGRFLTEESRLRREYRQILSDIVREYTQSHNITGYHKDQYLRVLEFRDRLHHTHSDLQKENKAKWERTHHPGRKLFSYR